MTAGSAGRFALFLLFLLGRDRRKQTFFIDARKLGTLIDRVHRELTDADLSGEKMPHLVELTLAKAA